MPSLAERQKEIDQKRGEIQKLFADHATAEGEYDLDADQIQEVNRRNDELGTLSAAYAEQKRLFDLQKELDAQEAEQKRLAAPPMPSSNGNGHSVETRTVGSATFFSMDANAQTKTIGERFTESIALTEYKGGVGPMGRIEVDPRDVLYHYRLPVAEGKTLMTTTAGWAPEVTRGPRLVLSAQTMPGVVDLMPSSTTTAAGIKYVEETTFNPPGGAITAANPAGLVVAEGGTKQEAQLQLTERYAPMIKLAVWIPVTEEQLADVPQVAGYINNRLTLMLRQALDAQIINGSGAGSPQQMLGILNVSTILTQAKAGNPTYDQIYLGMLQVQVTGKAMPSGILLHPSDWAIIRLTRTADGLYIWGPPNEVGPTQVWGLPVVQSVYCPQGTGVVGDWNTFSELVTRQGIDIQTSNSHGTFFVENKVAIRAELRAASLWYQGSAFCKLTGITAP